MDIKKLAKQANLIDKCEHEWECRKCHSVTRATVNRKIWEKALKELEKSKK